ncbi:TonB-dependent receptor [Martelella mediterranea]|uniref:TonB-dependent receptor n=1 Tax=Martelella mediterranea TaxID=293089 RepID=UPI0010436E78|nr:TonB-dependent receptor [Martelella mediterranea]
MLTKSSRRPARSQNQAANVDIEVKYDGLDAKPVLNVEMINSDRLYRMGENVEFVTSSNYPAFISKAEVRIFADDKPVTPDTMPVTTIPVRLNGGTVWQLPPLPEADKELTYVLRVYGKNGLYDETGPRRIFLSNDNGLLVGADASSAENRKRLAEARNQMQGELDLSRDYTKTRNIAINGGKVTIYGSNVPDGYSVEAFNDNVPIEDGRFVMQRILPAGDRDVGVKVLDPQGKEALQFSRDVDIPQSEWFYVGMADLTIGQNTGSDDIEDVRPGEYDEVYTKGRLTYYLKGKIKGKYLLTSSVDTGEGDLKDIFSDLGEKNARDALKNLDPNDYYPVYGDDSTAVEDAPTRGKFFVRLQHNNSQVMWGDYKVKIDGTELQRSDRALYGAQAVYQPDKSTSFGVPQTKVQVYGAQPDTLTATDQFLGTGGSVYFLNHDDLVANSETLTVEIRDGDTGVVRDTKTLIYGQDYTIDYIDGRVLLNDPLNSRTGSSSAVSDGAVGGNDVYLVVQYDYDPATEDVDGYVYGGRAEQWLGDHVRVGVTGSSDSTGDVSSSAYGGDVRLRYTDRTYIDGEIANTDGPASGQSISTDGGLTFSEMNTRSIDKGALGWRLAGQADLSDFNEAAEGLLKGYFEHKDAGFTSLTDDLDAPETKWGASISELAVTDYLDLSLSYDYYDRDSYFNKESNSVVAGRQKQQGDLTLKQQINADWALSYGLGYTLQRDPSETNAGDYGADGQRLDGGLRLTRTLDDDISTIYAFGQATAYREGNIDRNDRLGVGTSYQLTERVAVNGEVSYGTSGIGGLAGISYRPNNDDRYYVNYVVDPNRSSDWSRSYDLYGTDLGTVVVGAEKRVDDMWSVYAENNYDFYGDRLSTTRGYGIKFAPDTVVTVDAQYQGGLVNDNTIDETTGLKNPDFNRDAFSLAFDYDDEEQGLSARLKGETRFQSSSDGKRNVDSYLTSGFLNYKTNENWRLLTSLDAVWNNVGENATSSFADYVEATVGYAYRPIDNDRFNALFRYTFLYDMPTISNAAVYGDRDGPAQRAHILNADLSYDLTKQLTLGAKYGFRIGESRQRLSDPVYGDFYSDWENSNQHLAILRADFHVVNNWDFLAEGRALYSQSSNTTDLGALTALYRHFGENVKVGLGYNFADFSDDLRDQTFNNRGWFINIVGKI